jgi:hypothetical protein
MEKEYWRRDGEEVKHGRRLEGGNGKEHEKIRETGLKGELKGEKEEWSRKGKEEWRPEGQEVGHNEGQQEMTQRRRGRMSGRGLEGEHGEGQRE